MHLTIDNIGPIKHVEINLNKINVFIGPQSSGKSTIAKIISFCFWLEKDVLLRRTCKHIHHLYIDELLLDFHKLRNYLNENYSIIFKGKFITFTYNSEQCHAEVESDFREYKVGKVAYIPAERNIVSLPNISTFKMPENSTRSFIFDWLTIHQKFQRQNSINLLKLNLKYFYEESSQKDMIVLEDGKEITLEEASSGLQSVVPLYVYMNYLFYWIYENKEDTSFKRENELNDIVVKEYILKKITKKSEVDDDIIGKNPGYAPIIKPLEEYLKNLILKGDTPEFLKEGAPESIKEIVEIRERIIRPHFSTIIMEEPELNLFPETQKDLVYDMLNMFKHNRDRLVITTHSQYILYALNNCMLGYLVKNKIPEEETDLKSIAKSFINPEYVSVWEIRNGEFSSYENNPNYTIQDKAGLIRNNYFDRVMNNIVSDFFSMTNYYED